MATIQQLESEIQKIKERNKRVEIDKAWEISWSRKIVIAGLTYTAVGLFLSFTNMQNPWENAIIATVGFFLANMTIPFFKDLWIKYIFKQK